MSKCFRGRTDTPHGNQGIKDAIDNNLVTIAEVNIDDQGRITITLKEDGTMKNQEWKNFLIGNLEKSLTS